MKNCQVINNCNIALSCKICMKVCENWDICKIFLTFWPRLDVISIDGAFAGISVDPAQADGRESLE